MGTQHRSPSPGSPPTPLLHPPATTQRPTFMKCAPRAASKLAFTQEFQPHQIGLCRPFSQSEMTASSLEVGPSIRLWGIPSGPAIF